MKYAIFIYLGVLAVVFVLGTIIGTYNKFRRLKNKVKQSKSTIDVYLTKRFDLIPNLVECVKAYSKYEESTFTKVVELRNSYDKNKDIVEAEKTYVEFDNLIARVEAYPELKASEQFLNLQVNLQKIEDELQAARRLYNGDVTLYNTAIESFPSSILAKIFSFKKENVFEIEDAKRENVKVEI